MSKPAVVVSEVWSRESGRRPGSTGWSDLSHKFEATIAERRADGYVLKDWRLSSVVFDDEIVDTIVAVFQRAWAEYGHDV